MCEGNISSLSMCRRPVSLRNMTGIDDYSPYGRSLQAPGNFAKRSMRFGRARVTVPPTLLARADEVIA